MSNPIRYKDCSHVECFDLKSFFDVVFQFPYDKLECPICQKKFDFEVLLDESNSDPEPLSGKVYSPHFQIKYSIVNNAKSPSISWPFKPNNKTTADVINDMITRRFNYDIAMKAILDETTVDAILAVFSRKFKNYTISCSLASLARCLFLVNHTRLQVAAWTACTAGFLGF